jgi:hypothetical protein
MAMHTLRQCLRMKIAAAFIAILAVALLALPSLMTGDGTLQGKVQTFLNYSIGVTIALLTLVTLLLSVATISSDVKDRWVFTLVTKPLARYQYILGRWLGIVALDAILLAVAGGSIYLIAQYLRGTPALNPDDWRGVENEVFTARRRVRPVPLEVDDRIAERIGEMRRQGTYDQSVESLLPRAGGDRDRAEQMLLEEIRKQVLEQEQSCGPGEALAWRFEGIEPAGGQTRAEGTVDVLRVDDPQNPSGYLARISAPAHLVRSLVDRGPVLVEGVRGIVRQVEGGRVAGENAQTGPGASGDGGRHSFVAEFPSEGFEGLGGLEEGQDVEIVAETLMQLDYKVNTARRPPDGLLASVWEVGPPGSLRQRSFRNDPTETVNTIPLFAYAVEPGKPLQVVFRNVAARFRTSALILHEDISVLYRVGAFGPNFLRGMGLILIHLAFVAAMGVACGSFLSFPVGILAGSSLLPFALAREWVGQAVGIDSYVGNEGLFMWFARMLFQAMAMLLPDLESAAPVHELTEGIYLPWGWGSADVVGITGALVPALVRMALLVAVACFVFQKRELARVQVQ